MYRPMNLCQASKPFKLALSEVGKALHSSYHAFIVGLVHIFQTSAHYCIAAFLERQKITSWGFVILQPLLHPNVQGHGIMLGESQCGLAGKNWKKTEKKGKYIGGSFFFPPFFFFKFEARILRTKVQTSGCAEGLPGPLCARYTACVALALEYLHIKERKNFCTAAKMHN